MQNRKRKLGRKLLSAAALLAAALALLPAYVRAYALSGNSAAPTLLLGDRVWVNHGVYDICFPYSNCVLLARRDPALGELVQVMSPEDGSLIFKRIVALPGDRVAMHDHRLSINGRPCAYSATDNAAFAYVPVENHLRSVIETEVLGLQAHLTTYTPGSVRSSFPEVVVPPGHYYLLGDNRDQSQDSRNWGPASRRSIRGRVFHQPQRP